MADLSIVFLVDTIFPLAFVLEKLASTIESPLNPNVVFPLKKWWCRGFAHHQVCSSMFLMQVLYYFPRDLFSGLLCHQIFLLT